MVFSFRIKRKDGEQSCSYSSAEIAGEFVDHIQSLRLAASAVPLPGPVGDESWGDPDDWEPIGYMGDRYLPYFNDQNEELDNE